ncbi:MAG TPA: hypothetical protein VL463_31200 [Kofleriaceae bacterium]|nr:hypothetical protein [Kofleriaceae bacterium]
MRALIVLAVIARTAAADPSVPPDLATYGPGGLRLGDDVLFKDEVDGAAYDPSQDLIWFESKGTLRVVDLRDPKRAVIVILTKMPQTGFEIGGFSNASFGTIYTDVYLHLELAKKPGISAPTAVYAIADPDGAKKHAKQIKKTVISGRAWITAQLKRAAVSRPSPPARAEPAAITLPAGTGQCDQYANGCGDAMWFGDSPLMMVVVQSACGDACFRGCALYDPKSKKFAPLGESGEWGALTDKTAVTNCMDVNIAPDDTRFLSDKKVCILGAKLTCTDLDPWTPFAWVFAPSSSH